MSWPGKLAIAVQDFSSSLPVATTSVAAVSNHCSNTCDCECKCCCGIVQKYVNFDVKAMASCGPVQKMVRLSTSDLLMLLRVSQSRENFWNNQIYKVDMRADYVALAAAFETQDKAIYLSQLERIMDTITSGYRRAVAKLTGNEAHAALKPNAVTASFPGLRCGCTDCKLLPWEKLEQLETHQLQHKPSDNWHCCICYRRYFIQNTLLSHQTRHIKRDQPAPLMENASYKQLVESQFLQEQELEDITTVELLTVKLPGRHYMDFVSEIETCKSIPPRKRNLQRLCVLCNRTYKYSFSYQLHMLTQHSVVNDSKRWSCYSCDRVFRTRRSYLKHVRHVRSAYRKRVRKFKCSSCKGGFQLERAVYRHYSERHAKHYKCLICSKISLQRCCSAHTKAESVAAVQAHMDKCRKAMGLPPKDRNYPKRVVKCDICQKVLICQYLLDIHIKRVHLKQADELCDYCGRAFYSRKDVVRHIQIVHLAIDAVYCEVCNITIKDRGNYLRHCEAARHKALSAKLAKEQGKEPKDMKDITIYCAPCDASFHQNKFKLHCQTKKHKRNAEDFGENENMK